MRKNISSGTPWEDKVGYSRAVRTGQSIEVSGTVAVDENGVVAPGDAHAQTAFILKKIEDAIVAAGGTLEDITRTRIYVTDISKWREVGRAHAAVFRNIRPATTMVEVSALISPGMVVEIEATAVVP